MILNIFEEINKLSMGDRVQTYIFIFSFVFMVFSSLGWVLELLFRRFFSAKRWVNPGFLTGPCLPIYGIGVLSLTIYVLALLPAKPYFPNEILFDVVIVLGIGILMTLIELVGGLIFIKKMNIRLWDYSKRLGNYKGIICPLFSLIWMVMGALFYFFLFDHIVILVTKFVTLDWFTLAVFLMGIYYGVLIIDFAHSLSLGKRLKKAAEESKFVIKWENFKEHIQMELKERHLKSSFISPFKSSLPLNEHLRQFLNKNNCEKWEKTEDNEKTVENDSKAD